MTAHCRSSSIAKCRPPKSSFRLEIRSEGAKSGKYAGWRKTSYFRRLSKLWVSFAECRVDGAELSIFYINFHKSKKTLSKLNWQKIILCLEILHQHSLEVLCLMAAYFSRWKQCNLTFEMSHAYIYKERGDTLERKKRLWLIQCTHDVELSWLFFLSKNGQGIFLEWQHWNVMGWNFEKIQYLSVRTHC